MRGGIAIKGNDTRRTPLCLQCFAEEECSSHYLAPATQSEIDGPAFPVHGTVKINPNAADLDIGNFCISF